MLLTHWLDGVRRKLFPRWFWRPKLLRHSRLRSRRRASRSPLAACVTVLEERVLLSSVASVPLGTETLVNSTIPGDQKFTSQTDRSFAITGDGSAFVAWSSPTQTVQKTSGQTIVARRLDSQGQPLGGEIQ